jgi:hypothetical protein
MSEMSEVVVQICYGRGSQQVNFQPDFIALVQIERRLNRKRFRVGAGFISPLHVDLAHCTPNRGWVDTCGSFFPQGCGALACQRSGSTSCNSGHGEKVSTFDWGLKVVE